MNLNKRRDSGERGLVCDVQSARVKEPGTWSLDILNPYDRVCWRSPTVASCSVAVDSTFASVGKDAVPPNTSCG